MKAQRRTRTANVVSDTAAVLGRLGGPARAAVLTPGERRAIGRMGARARNRVLTRARRREIARGAALARWAQARGTSAEREVRRSNARGSLTLLTCSAQSRRSQRRMSGITGVESDAHPARRSG
jgi:hypothetical protein